MYAYPIYPERNTQSLDGIWDFSFLGSDAPKLESVNPKGIACRELAAVPGCFDAAPKYAGRRGVGVYRRSVEAPAGVRLRLRIGALGLRGRILWDGREIGLNELPYSLQEYEFDSGSSSRHELVILIDNRLDFADTPLFHHFYDFYGYGGIYRSVELETLPEKARFGRVRVETLDLSGRVLVSGTLGGGFAEISAGFDGAAPKKVDAVFNGEEFSFEAKVPSPALWSPDSPNLHLITLKTGSDTVIERFGLRTIRCEKGELLLNGQPLRLRGYNRHDAHPQFGPAMPDELWIEDLQILRDLGCNFIRGCHYPQSQRFLDLCDQLGFLVWEESLGWGDSVEVQSDPKFRRLQVEQTVNMVKVSINHPSVILWGFMNESGDDKEVGASLLRTRRRSPCRRPQPPRHQRLDAYPDVDRARCVRCRQFQPLSGLVRGRQHRRPASARPDRPDARRSTRPPQYEGAARQAAHSERNRRRRDLRLAGPGGRDLERRVSGRLS